MVAGRPCAASDVFTGLQGGLLSGLKRFMKRSDWALITPGDAPLLGAPAFVALMPVHEETTNVSD